MPLESLGIHLQNRQHGLISFVSFYQYYSSAYNSVVGTQATSSLSGTSDDFVKSLSFLDGSNLQDRLTGDSTDSVFKCSLGLNQSYFNAFVGVYNIYLLSLPKTSSADS